MGEHKWSYVHTYLLTCFNSYTSVYPLCIGANSSVATGKCSLPTAQPWQKYHCALVPICQLLDKMFFKKHFKWISVVQNKNHAIRATAVPIGKFMMLSRPLSWLGMEQHSHSPAQLPSASRFCESRCFEAGGIDTLPQYYCNYYNSVPMLLSIVMFSMFFVIIVTSYFCILFT